MPTRKTMRERNGKWCTLEVSNDREYLSICASFGRVITSAKAKRDALGYWRSFFEEDPAQMFEMNKRCGTRFTSPTGAARYVLANDGQYHGLDVTHEEGTGRSGKVYVLDGCGAGGADLLEWFPEIAPVLRWHLFGFKGSDHPGPMHYEANAIYWADVATGRERGSEYQSTPPVECFKHTVVFGALEDDAGEPWTLAPKVETTEEAENAWGGPGTLREMVPGPLVEWLRARLPRLFEAFARDVRACPFTTWTLGGES